MEKNTQLFNLLSCFWYLTWNQTHGIHLRLAWYLVLWICFHVCLHLFLRKENNNIFVDDLNEEEEKRQIPNPCRTFLEAFELYPEIMENIDRVGFTKPTPIQVWSWHHSSFCFCLFVCLFFMSLTIFKLINLLISCNDKYFECAKSDESELAQISLLEFSDVCKTKYFSLFYV